MHYALVAFWERSGCKIVADYPATQDSSAQGDRVEHGGWTEVGGER